ncbi:MAG: hypothetical protein AAF583_02720 [Pseudomonadota bacterium]
MIHAMAETAKPRSFTLTGFPVDIDTSEGWRVFIAERQGVYDRLLGDLKNMRKDGALPADQFIRTLSRLDLISDHIMRAERALEAMGGEA